MLFELAAVLTTSGTLGIVAEAFVVPSQLSAVSSNVSVESTMRVSILPATGSLATQAGPVSPVTIPDPFIGPRPALGSLSTEYIAALSGRPLLQQLGMLTKDSLASFVESHPDVIARAVNAPPSARTVSTWWTSLTLRGRETVIGGAPQLVGNLDGIPVAIRDIANRSFLWQSIDSLRATIAADPGRGAASEARSQLHMLDEISTALGSKASLPARTLMSIDPAGRGKASIVLGDLTNADYVSYMVPGMWFTVDGQIGDWTDSAARLYEEQQSWLQLFSNGDVTEQSKTVAVVAWMGYETPDLTNIGSLDLAYQGRDAITSAIEGLQSVRGDNQPYVSILAHSYGSTAVLMALTENDFEVDALALVGSPGSAAQSVDELHVRNANVYVGEAALDFVPNTAFFGSDPGAASFGAHPMGVAGGVDLITHERLAPALLHNDYFATGTESMRNMALIGIDKARYVSWGDASQVAANLSTVR